MTIAKIWWENFENVSTDNYIKTNFNSVLFSFYRSLGCCQKWNGLANSRRQIVVPKLFGPRLLRIFKRRSSKEMYFGSMQTEVWRDRSLWIPIFPNEYWLNFRVASGDLSWKCSWVKKLSCVKKAAKQKSPFNENPKMDDLFS